MSELERLEPRIREVFAEIYSNQNGGASCPDLSDDTILLDTGLDSLGFAILVTRLEETLGFDPFSLVEDAYYPRTFREFVDFYEDHCPR